MTYLLDVNVLIALADTRHVNHEAAHRWFAESGPSDWATCPTTELGYIRVLSNPAYPATPLTPGEVSTRLAQFCSSSGHVFWPDDVPPRSSLDGDVRGRLQGHRQVTDFHLVALASRYGGCLVTFDGRLARALAGTLLASAVMLVE